MHRAHLKASVFFADAFFFSRRHDAGRLSTLTSQLTPSVADLIVNGGKPLSGTITPSGNKNSVLPILCATLLTDQPVALLNVPDITDV